MVSISEMLSPGVFVQEIDLSTYAAIMNTSKIYGIVTLAQNGPINEVVDINSIDKYEEIFGEPISAGGLACINILKNTSSLKVVRFAGASAAARNVVLAGTKNDTDHTAIASAVNVAYKNKGTLFADPLKLTVASISGQDPDKFNLTIIKGEDEELLNQNFTIVASNASSDYPYLIGYDKSDFVFTLITAETLESITAVVDSPFTTGDNGTTYTDTDVNDAIEEFNDSENVDLDILAVPGIYSGSVFTKLDNVGNSRKDIVVLYDPPLGLDVNDVVEFVNGENTDFPISKLDTTYGAMYYPWGYLYNSYSQSFEWVPPSVGVISAMAAEYVIYDNWTAPAGIPRLAITIFSKLEKKLNRSDRDTLYVNNINPLCNYKGQGLTSLGQKTLQRKKSSTDRLNVRFLTNYIKKFADYASFFYLFTEISDSTFESWKQDIDKQLSNLKHRNALYDYKITMDWTTVTDEMLNNNIMPGIIQIKPTKTAEFIPIDVVLRNKSDDFT